MLLALNMRQTVGSLGRLLARPRFRGRCGVTLIEVVLVVLILGGAAVATSFKMDNQWTDRRDSRASTYDLSRLITLARNTAIEKQTTVRVSYSGSAGANQITIDEAPGPLTPGRQWSTQLSNRVSVQGRPSSIQFLADGSANSSLQWNVACNGVAGEIRVSPVGGAIQTKAP